MSEKNLLTTSLILLATLFQICHGAMDFADFFIWKRVVPRYIPEPPPEPCKIFWEFKVNPRQLIEILPAEKLQWFETAKKPFLRWQPRENTTYTMIMGAMMLHLRDTYWIKAYTTTVRPTITPEWLHWMVVNIPSNNVSRGDVIMPYRPIAPPNDSLIIEYYIVTIYEQTEKISMDKNGTFDRRRVHHTPGGLIGNVIESLKLGKLHAAGFFQNFIPRTPLFRINYFHTYEEETDPPPYTDPPSSELTEPPTSTDSPSTSPPPTAKR